MEEEKKVYVVTSGDYSDYHIVGIFDSREKADEYVNYSSDRELNDIEEWTLNELQPNKEEKVFELVSEFENIDFKVSRCLEKTSVFKDLMDITSVDWMSSQLISFFVRADTRERAIKIASERFRQVKAEEHFRYPLLRRPISVNLHSMRKQIYPFVHYCTGEVILPTACTLIPNTIPEDYKPRLKIITMEELKERLKEEQE